MWIETLQPGWPWPAIANSFASNGECGLKRSPAMRWQAWCWEFIRQQWRMWIETNPASPCPHDAINSFASNGECGLKHRAVKCQRQVVANSFASNGECGLKHENSPSLMNRPAEFIRQQWRMWIETACATRRVGRINCNSFASNGECGLKHTWAGHLALPNVNSFVSNGECGLKRMSAATDTTPARIHSPAMANVD